MARRADHSRPELREMILVATEDILDQEGLNGLSIRKIADRIGYSSGTLYQIFGSLDELIVEAHIRSFQRLYRELETVEIGDDPEAALLALARVYLRFAQKYPRRWSAVFQHSLPKGHDLPERYHIHVDGLLGLGRKALAPLYGSEFDEGARQNARIIWASLYGIVSLELASKLSKIDEVEEFIEVLIRNFLSGLKNGSGV